MSRSTIFACAAESSFLSNSDVIDSKDFGTDLVFFFCFPCDCEAAWDDTGNVGKAEDGKGKDKTGKVDDLTEVLRVESEFELGPGYCCTVAGDEAGTGEVDAVDVVGINVNVDLSPGIDDGKVVPGDTAIGLSKDCDDDDKAAGSRRVDSGGLLQVFLCSLIQDLWK